MVYTDQDGEASQGLVSALLSRAGECGLAVADALYVGRDGWGSYLADDEPHPLSEINAVLAAGHPVAASQHAGTEIPDVEPERLDAVTTAFEGFGLGDAREADWITLGEAAVSTPADEIDPLDAVCLISALTRPALRDVALVQVGHRPGGRRTRRPRTGRLGARQGVPRRPRRDHLGRRAPTRPASTRP